MSVPPKRVTNTDTGTANVIGGDDWDALADYFNDVDKTGPVKINTTTQYKTSKLRKRNPADTFSYIEATSAIAADRTVTEPLLTGDDTRVYQAMTQPLTNKTLDSTNTISSATSLPTVSVAKGGTGAATATLGFDALSPMTALGDLILGSTAGTRIRLGVGTANQAFKVNAGGTAPEYGTLAVGGGGTGATTLTGIMKGNGTGAVTAAAQLAVADGGTGAATLTGVVKGNGTGALTAAAQLAVADGGTGAATLTGVLKGNGTSAITAASQLAVADGGTGAATLTGVLVGNGTSAFTTLTGSFYGQWTALNSGTSNTARYFPINAGVTSVLTEADIGMIFPYAVTLKRVRYIVSGNTKDGSTTMAFRDDSADVQAFTATAGSNTDFDSGAISTVVAANSVVNFRLDASASTSGTIVAYMYVIWEASII